MAKKYLPIFRELSEDYQSEVVSAKNMAPNNNASETETDIDEEQEIFSPPKATLYFAHSETVLPFLTLLGLNKDDYALYVRTHVQVGMTGILTNIWFFGIFFS